MLQLLVACALAICIASPARPARAQPAQETTAGPPATAAASVERVEITGQHYDSAVGTSDAASQGAIGAELLKSRPTLRPGELLAHVPGLTVTQHSGDGKANQYFLRGFNLDHGTDFATSIEGMPVNMPTHAHGQGYTDLNFLIPELVQRIEYRKGPYFANSGNFASAGAADIAYRRRLEAPFGVLTLGEGGYRRGVAGQSTEVAPGVVLLGAVELMGNDGPWTVRENLRRANGVLTLSGGSAERGWHATAMVYDARWTSTDQVPQRLIDAGVLQGRGFGRFDSLDPTDGGGSSRYSLSGGWHRGGDTAATQVSAYAMRYRLQLYSNFTYALERPADGDQFFQKDSRGVYGMNANRSVSHALFGLPARSDLGVQARQDRIRLGLYDSRSREITAATREDTVRESHLGIYGQTAVELAPWLRGVAGLRGDHLRARVDSLRLAANSGSASESRLSPKLSLILGPFRRTEFFINAGHGFHSNDARGMTATVDPKTGASLDRVPGLAASRGMELGARTEALPGLQCSLALWRLDFDSELVYAGDAGTTEPRPASRRRGVEFNSRWAPARWLLLDADFAWTRARFANGDRIPNAVDSTASVAARLRNLGPWSMTLQLRYVGGGALTEDNAARAQASLIANLRIARALGSPLGSGSELMLDAFNLFDRKVSDIQYFYPSQLPGEAGPVADRHVHPAEPRTLRLTLKIGI